MKIGFDAKRAFHNSRGLGNFSRTLISGLVSSFPDHHYNLFTPPIKSFEYEKWGQELSKDGDIEIFSPTEGMMKKLPSLWRSVMLSKDLEKSSLDIYHGLSHELPPGIERLDLKSVVTIHDLIFLRFPKFFPWIDRKVYKWKFKHSCEKADKIIAICNQTKKDLINFLDVEEEKIQVLYQSVDPSFYNLWEAKRLQKLKEKYKLEKPFILHVGALEERKNALSLISAYAFLDENKDYDLVLVGNGKSYKDKVERRIKELGMGDRIRIISKVSFEDLPGFYQSASVFVWPSYFEGFGLPIVESLFSHCPVITSKGSVFPESGGEGTIYIDPDSPEEIRDAISSVLSSETLRQEMIEKGIKHSEQFKIETTSKNLMEFYKSIL
ncbi:MAG: glycosyltransferase family 4 protein [Bacteriovoracaceae bacterium]|nr:glycosyltransferase family 4 protein [Bacteriovoracaceae bacterium]